VRFQLDNGLKWLYAPLHHSPVAAIQVWVGAGSADEQEGEFGLAHLHEHMLFKGTRRRGPGEIARDVEAHGGEINAWTSFDQTVYHVVLASRFFAEGVDILADAIRESAFDSGELSREIEVVVEEIKRSLDMPGRKLSKASFALSFGQHPYGRPVIGSEESVRSMDRDKMLAFFRKHYRPDNVTVVVTGDVSLESAKQEVERRFGGTWGRPKITLPPRPAGPKQSAPQVQVLFDDVKEAHVSLSFPIPGIDSPELPALDVLAVVLGQGEASRFEVQVKRKQLANDARAYAYTPKDPGMFGLDATLEPELLGKAVPAMLAEALLLRDELCGEDELAAAQSMLEADAIYQRETVQGVARRLGFFETVAGGEEQEQLYQQRVAALTPEAIRDVARKYLDLQQCTAVVLVPNGTKLDEASLRHWVEDAKSAAKGQRPNRPPEIPYKASALEALKPSAPEKIRKHTLSNGVTLVVKPERGVPLVAFRAVLPGGLLFETEANNGLHQLLARTLTQGTAKRDAESIARLTDAMAASLSGHGGRNSIGLRGEFLSRHFERGLDLFAECLLEPSFADEEVERERSLQLQQIKARDDHPSGVAFRLFNQGLYGAHPYHLDMQGEMESVAKMDRAALKAAHEARLRGESLVLAVVGECDPDEVLRQVEARFGKLPKQAGARPSYPAVKSATESVLVQQDAQKAQAHLVYGMLGTTLQDADRYPLEVLSSVLSGQGGRLFVELRDKKSLAYSVSSFTLEGVDPGYFAVYMGTSPEKVDEAFRGIREQLQRIRSERVEGAELERARSYLIGSHAIGLQKNASRAAVMALDEAYGLGADHHLSYEERILAVDAEALRRVAERFLQLDRAVLAVLGPKPTSWK
jgi:zinc protease